MTLVLAASVHAQNMDAEAARRAAEQLQAQMMQGGAPGGYQVPDAVPLSDKDVEGILKALPELNALGLRSGTLDSPDSATAMARAMASNEEALGIIQSFGFTPQSFQQVLYSIGLAFGAIEAEAQGVDLAAAQAQQDQMMAQMKSQMTPDQYAMMQGNIGGAMNALKKMQDQPAGNIDTVKKYLPQLRKLFDSMQ